MKQFGDWSKVKRAQVTFKHLDEVLPEPSENTKYKVEIVSVGQLFGGTNMINTTRDVEAADILYKNQDPVIDFYGELVFTRDI